MGAVRWLLDGNNIFGSRPDGWWNNRPRAADRLTDAVAAWCRGHDDEVVLVFDPPVAPSTLACSGGNLTVVEAPRRGRNAADDHLVELADAALRHRDGATDDGDGARSSSTLVTVVSSDKALLQRLPPGTGIMGVGRFRQLIGY